MKSVIRSLIEDFLRHCAFLSAALIALTGVAAASLPPIGPWKGQYRCAQGETALNLQITAQSPSRVKAIFYFHALADNPHIPPGCFTMHGKFDAATRRIVLTPGRWLHRPPFFVSVGLHGTLSASGQILSGTVGGPACSTFLLTRSFAPPEPPAPSSCRIGQQGPVV